MFLDHFDYIKKEVTVIRHNEVNFLVRIHKKNIYNFTFYYFNVMSE